MLRSIFKESLKIMKISAKSLKNKTVFNIGTGREAKVFAKYGPFSYPFRHGQRNSQRNKKKPKMIPKFIKS